MLFFCDEDPGEGYGARVKLLFDETIVEHLDPEEESFYKEGYEEVEEMIEKVKKGAG